MNIHGIISNNQKIATLTFSEAIKFIREHPSYEIMEQSTDVSQFTGVWYNEDSQQIFCEEIEDLCWREEPGKKWKEFTKIK